MPTTEERLAALEKQMAAWIDQQPTTYYTHQYSGEEIDAAVGRAVSGGALDTSVTNVSNQLGTFVRPNLLDNWYFGRPVNQRGQTEYTGGYSIDRWQLLDKNKLVITDNAVELTYIDNNYVVWEKLESIPKGTYSLSLLFADGAFVTWSGVVDISQAGFEVGTVRHKNWNIVIHNDKTVRITCIGSIGDKVAILAVKLELGHTQTLAHREGDRWVLNEMPDYGEQLRRCQWYSNVLPGIYWLPQNADGANRLTIPIPDMRTIPAVTYEPADGSTGTLYYDANLAQKNSIQFYATGATGICGVKNIRISADL